MKRIYITLLSISLGISATAQQSLSVSEALEICLANNLQLKYQAKQVQISENNNNWANAGRSPKVEVNLSNISGVRKSNNPANLFLPEVLSYDNNTSGGIDMSLVLFNGGLIKYNKANLELLDEQAKLNLKISIEDLTEQLMLAYYQILLVEEQQVVLGNVKQLSKDRLDFQELKREYGAASTFDVLQAKDAYLNDSISTVQLDNQLLALYNNLKLIMGVYGSDMTFSLSDKLETIIPLLEKDALEERMLANNTELLNLRLSDEIRANAINIEKASLKPSIGLGLGLNGSLGNNYVDANIPNTNDLIGSIMSTDINPFLGFTASYTIFDGGVRKTRISNAEIQYNANKDLLRNAEQRVSTQFDNTYLQMQSNARIVEMSEQQLKNAAQNIDIAKDRFENGLISSFDYRSIQLAYLNASQRLLEARFELVNSQIGLLNLTGGLYSMN